MKITELEGSQFCSMESANCAKEPEHKRIEREITEFMDGGGSIESIPTGTSSNTYSPIRVTAKENRKKLKVAVQRQIARTTNG